MPKFDGSLGKLLEYVSERQNVESLSNSDENFERIFMGDVFHHVNDPERVYDKFVVH